MSPSVLLALFLMLGMLLVFIQLFRDQRRRAETLAERRMRALLATGDLLSVEKEQASRDKPGMVDKLAARLSASAYLQGDQEARSFMNQLDSLLTQAGIRDKYTPERAVAFALIIWALGIAGPIAVNLAYPFPPIVLGIAILFVLAYPYLKLKMMVTARQDSIKAEMPFFIQQMYMAFSTGMATIDDAIVRIARTSEEDPYDSVLAREFAQAHIEYRVGGKTMEQALRDISDRTGVFTVDSLIEALVEGLRSGTEMTQVLAEYAVQARELWRQDMRTYKNKKEPLTTLGMVVTMFGAFTFWLIPFVLQLVEGFAGFGG